MSGSIRLDQLAFYWRMTDSPHAGSVVPEFLPFEFGFIDDLQLIIQKRDPRVLDCLKKIYHEASNVGYLQEGHALAESYGRDFIEFISRQAGLDSGKLVAEIGCGGAYVLNELRKMGARVIGIDPSPVAVEQGRKLQIEIVQDFYPTEKLTTRADYIIHYDVLEHVEDPVKFLQAHRRDLTDDGQIIFGVPDCSECIACGDISMVLHEHLNYFDHESLAATVARAGFEVMSVESSNYGGVLYCAARRIAVEHCDFGPAGDSDKFESFVSKYESIVGRIEDYVSSLSPNPQNTLGFYVPLRMLPYMAALNLETECRFFDDDPGIHHKYFDGYAIKVENMSDLIESPTSHVIVGSFSFGEKIKAKIQGLVGNRIEVKTLADFISA